MTGRHRRIDAAPCRHCWTASILQRMSTNSVLQTVERYGIIGILRSPAPVDLLSTCGALLKGGMPLLEITLNTPGALSGIAQVRRGLGDVVIGAGTILCPTDARAAIDAGAQFIVTPTLQLDTIAECRQRQVPILCGAMTPTEILAAHNAGADYVKLFPAGSLGLEYIKAVLAPLPFVKIVPTGGVSLANIADFLRVCPATGVGGNLVDLKLIAQGKWDQLTAVARQFAEAAGTVKGVRSER